MLIANHLQFSKKADRRKFYFETAGLQRPGRKTIGVRGALS
jgi:hypothetical protein